MERKNRMKLYIIPCLLLAAVLLLLIRQNRAMDVGQYSDRQVALFEVAEELSFGSYEKEKWENFFSAYHKDYLTGAMLRQILEELHLTDYVELPKLSEKETVTRETWNTVYGQILDLLDMEEEVARNQILVLDTMSSEKRNVLITNWGDFDTILPVSYFEKWNVYDIYKIENTCIGVEKNSGEPEEISNAYMKEYTDEHFVFLYGGAEYTKEFEKKQESCEIPEAGVCDLVFAGGNLQTVRMKQDSIQGALLSYDEHTIEIEGYGVIEHTGKLPVYQTYGEVAETSITQVVLGNMKLEYVTGEGEVCAILITRPADIADIRVLLLAADGGNFREDVYLKCSTDAVLHYGEKSTLAEADAVMHPKEYSTETFVVEPRNGEGKIYLCDATGNPISNGYEGSMEVRKYAEGYTVVNQLPFESYLTAVVPSEMPSSYAPEALRAQAVCARSYAYIQLLQADLAEYGAHINDSTAYQVYNKTAATEQSKAAVYDTAGQILTCGGEPVEAYYYSTSMGYTDTAEVWNVEVPSEYAYLKRVCLLQRPFQGDLSEEAAFLEYITKPAEGYDSEVKFFRWTAEADYREKTKQINEILENRHAIRAENVLYYEKDGKTPADSTGNMGKLKNISVAERSPSGSVLTLKLNYEKGVVLVKTEYNIRKVLGCTLQKITYQDGSESSDVTMLPSAVFAIKTQNDRLLLQGGGYGHGLGMSQNAANGMAKAGMNYEDILQYFYNHIKIEQMKEFQ